MNLIKIDTQETVSASELYGKLTKGKENITPFSIWIGRAIRKYGFEQSVDFITEMLESTGGRRKREYHITYTMAKELCMLDDTKIGRAIRKSYIELENKCRLKQLTRLVGIETRKSLTDKVKDSGENERMHGFAYSSYTKLVYNLCGIEYNKEKDFRSKLCISDLKRVETVEKMIDAFLAMGKQYKEIKSNLTKIISFKEENSTTD